jgi:hypothetical protein
MNRTGARKVPMDAPICVVDSGEQIVYVKRMDKAATGLEILFERSEALQTVIEAAHALRRPVTDVTADDVERWTTLGWKGPRGMVIRPE